MDNNEKARYGAGWHVAAVLAASLALSTDVIAETTLQWRFDASGRAGLTVAPETKPANLPGGLETAFWDRQGSNAISVSSYPCGITIIIR